MTGEKRGLEQVNDFPYDTSQIADRLGTGSQGLPAVPNTHSTKPYLKWFDIDGKEEDTIGTPIQPDLKWLNRSISS